jgi:hypothetical protein
MFKSEAYILLGGFLRKISAIVTRHPNTNSEPSNARIGEICLSQAAGIVSYGDIEV